MRVAHSDYTFYGQTLHKANTAHTQQRDMSIRYHIVSSHLGNLQNNQSMLGS